ncbi:putative membrane protein [Paenibacillus castaneae]|uniref:hypothetical protein n=1 Tax=Paenibacillus castaneae TaxID=474957 RepID=UPI000C9A6828|nr:hypothetical protein [Paenibacillus castaneae]NIK76798.1 putative membrane protein [Paenibacillus castaneae]
MNKQLISLLLMLILLMVPQISSAESQENTSIFQIKIISPEQITDYPGKDVNIKISVKNMTDKEIKDVFTYITMANISKTWTVNLEDYSADQPITIGTISPHEEKIVELPIKLVYSADYYLYTTVLSKDSLNITSSHAIPVKILGNTRLVPLQVQIVSIAVPLLLLIALALTFKQRRAASA